MKDPTRLLQLCYDITSARQLGEMDLEYLLYFELIEIYRTQERILRTEHIEAHEQSSSASPDIASRDSNSSE